jgi:hypothetical protein
VEEARVVEHVRHVPPDLRASHRGRFLIHESVLEMAKPGLS